jgi:sulfur oxidation c-type cytochrome SoxX
MAGWHEEYRRRYARLKEAGKAFFPSTVFKDVVAAFAVLCLLLVLAYRFGAPLEELADPTDTSYNPRPEWYFLFLFQALKLFPGHLEAVAAVLVPGLAVLGLFLLPFLDRGPARHPRARPGWVLLGLAAMGAIAWLTWEGARSPLVNPVVARDPLVLEGQRLYRDLKCAYCHMIGGKGGMVGPELDRLDGTKTEEWLIAHFRNPQTMSAGSVMPKLGLLEEELRALSAYLVSLAPEPFTEEAPKLFATHCAACHTIRGGPAGGDLGPELPVAGAARAKPYFKTYIEDPSAVNPDSTMPGFRGELTDTQVEDLARYLASLEHNS